jgi:hypothetical protein
MCNSHKQQQKNRFIDLNDLPLSAASNMISYMGSILNYAIVGFAVVLGQMKEPTSQYVAEASFQLIMLIQVSHST